ncbi:hypothetical protein ACFRMN_16285 [Streptomyces sp. NPDC056835]|uniref:hypothetical protein n=1 Tax=Streptomyces sp. NPDC056835 TaxID=3345956 RepID=UPI0036A48270
MSEYQHYHFMVDESLTDGQLAEIRALTTRARLTRHSFVNTYTWGDFKGDPQALLESTYDAYLYFANWGTRQVSLRWPDTALPLDVAETYCAGAPATSRAAGGYVLISLESDSEGEAEDFIDLFDHGHDGDMGEQWLPSITRARSHVAEGDLRLLYLAWLLRLQAGELDDNDLEPPVPPGLAELPESLTDLATFLRIDPDLVAAAATGSPRPVPRPSLAAHRAWIATLDPGEKDAVLAQLLHGDDVQPLSGLRRRFQDTCTATAPDPAPRTVAELRAAVSAQRARRIAHEQQQEAEERERVVREAREAQDRRLSDLQHDPETAWQQAGELLTVRGTRHYREVVQLLSDLAALADRDDTMTAFTERYGEFITAHRTKKALLRALRADGPACAALIARTPATD